MKIKEFTSHDNFVSNGLVQRMAYVDSNYYQVRMISIVNLIDFLKAFNIKSEMISLDKYSNYYQRYHHLLRVTHFWKRMLKMTPSQSNKRAIKNTLQDFKKVDEKAKYHLRFNEVIIIQAKSDKRLQANLKLIKKIPNLKLMSRAEQIGFCDTEALQF